MNDPQTIGADTAQSVADLLIEVGLALLPPLVSILGVFFAIRLVTNWLFFGGLRRKKSPHYEVMTMTDAEYEDQWRKEIRDEAREERDYLIGKGYEIDPDRDTDYDLAKARRHRGLVEQLEQDERCERNGCTKGWCNTC